jgi:hypothetical protein
MYNTYHVLIVFFHQVIPKVADPGKVVDLADLLIDKMLDNI